MRIRWRVRALMVATAGVALLMTGARLWRQADANASQARVQEGLERARRLESQARRDSARGHWNFFEKFRRMAYDETTAQIAQQRAKLDSYRDAPGVTETLARRIARARGELDRKQAAWDEWIERETRATEAKVSTIEAEAATLASQAERHARLKREYQRAAYFPWERVRSEGSRGP